jgi:hypothetical protein
MKNYEDEGHQAMSLASLARDRINLPLHWRTIPNHEIRIDPLIYNHNLAMIPFHSDIPLSDLTTNLE